VHHRRYDDAVVKDKKLRISSMPRKIADDLDGMGMGGTLVHVREINQREQEIGVSRNVEL